MSNKVRERLRLLALYEQTTHQDRLDIDREIERRKGMNCDEAMELGLVNDEQFREIVELILRRKRKKKKQIVVPCIV